jgi:hypothetical protein
MNDIEKAKREGRGYYTSTRDPNLGANARGLNARAGQVSIGEAGDLKAPIMAVIQVNAGPGDPLRGPHLHYGDAINLIVSGAVCMDGTWLQPGQAKIAPGGLTYGDTIPSQDGYTFLEIWESHVGAMPEYFEPKHQQYYDEVHGKAYAGIFGFPSSKEDTGSAPAQQKPEQIVKFDEPDETWVQTGGLWTKCVFIGPENHPDSPIGIAIKADRNVSDYVASKRSFGTTTMMVVLDGSVMHDGRWMSQGDIYMSPPTEMNGDLVFGPQGALIFIMFDKRSGILPTFSNQIDQENFDNLLRRDAEEVASGKNEKSVAILPLREKHTEGRVIVYDTIEAVATYRAETGTDW